MFLLLGISYSIAEGGDVLLSQMQKVMSCVFCDNNKSSSLIYQRPYAAEEAFCISNTKKEGFCRLCLASDYLDGTDAQFQEIEGVADPDLKEAFYALKKTREEELTSGDDEIDEGCSLDDLIRCNREFEKGMMNAFRYLYEDA